MLVTKADHAEPVAKPGFQLERRSGLRDPDTRLKWAGELADNVNRYHSYHGISAFGTLSVARTRYDDESAEKLQFRSEPLAECGGAEFRFRLHHGHKQRHENAIVDHLCEAERRLLANRSELAGIVRGMRDATCELIHVHRADHPPVSMVAIACVYGIRVPMRLQVDLIMLGDNLTPGVARVQAPSLREMEQELGRALSSHARRHLLRSTLHRVGCRGRAAAEVGPMLMHARMSIDFAIEHLERHQELRFRCGKRRSVRACLTWNDGVLTCEFEDSALGLTFSENVLTISAQMLPETVLAALPGRRLDALVLHPCLPPHAVIVSAINDPGNRGGLKVALAPSSSPLPNRSVTVQGRVATE